MSGRVRHRTPVVVAGKAYARPRRKPQPRYPVDWALVAQLDAEGIRAKVPPATGRCHDCTRKVSGERRYCGPCLNRHRPGQERNAPPDPHMWPAAYGDTLRTALLDARIDTLVAGVIVADRPPVVDWTGDRS